MNIPLEPSTLIFGLALALLFGAIVALPLFDRSRPAVEPPTALEVLEGERAEIVRSIRELDFDSRTGKVEAVDYAALRAQLVERGARLLREIETMRAQTTSHDIGREIEEHVSRLRAHRTRACVKCAAVLRQNDKFCPQCGEKVPA